MQPRHVEMVNHFIEVLQEPDAKKKLAKAIRRAAKESGMDVDDLKKDLERAMDDPSVARSLWNMLLRPALIAALLTLGVAVGAHELGHDEFLQQPGGGGRRPLGIVAQIGALGGVLHGMWRERDPKIATFDFIAKVIRNVQDEIDAEDNPEDVTLRDISLLIADYLIEVLVTNPDNWAPLLDRIENYGTGTKAANKMKAKEAMAKIKKEESFEEMQTRWWDLGRLGESAGSRGY